MRRLQQRRVIIQAPLYQRGEIWIAFDQHRGITMRNEPAPLPSLRGAVLEAADVLANLAALGTLLTAIALISMIR